MALKDQAEEIRDKANRIVAIIIFAQQNSVAFQENDDLTLTLTPAIKQQLQNKVNQLKSEINAVTAVW